MCYVTSNWYATPQIINGAVLFLTNTRDVRTKQRDEFTMSTTNVLRQSDSLVIYVQCIYQDRDIANTAYTHGYSMLLLHSNGPMYMPSTYI